MKKLAVYFISILAILSLCYYSAKFYTHKQLLLSDAPKEWWIVLFTIILVSLVLGIFNFYKMNMLTKKQNELLEIIELVMLNSDKNCDKILESVYNSRDIFLDTYNWLKSKGE